MLHDTSVPPFISHAWFVMCIVMQAYHISGQFIVYITTHWCHEMWLLNLNLFALTLTKPGIERVQALAGISCPSLCCYSNETRAPIANPPYSAQLEGTLYYFRKLHPGPCSNVGMQQGTDRRTDRLPWPIYIHFASVHLTQNVTRHKASTSTRWYFAFGAMLSY